MENSLSCCSSKNKAKTLPIDTIFNLPSPIPSWPQGNSFASGYIDLGGLQVHQISSFNKIWKTYEGGPNGLGATFYEPTQIPDGFFMLGCYSQPNKQPLFGSILVAKDISSDLQTKTLAKPNDYTLIWSSESLKISQDGHGYIWSPMAPDGYKSVGYVVTTTPEKPAIDKVRCVLSELTDDSETENWIWAKSKNRNSVGFHVYSSRPINRGIKAQGVSVGTFEVKITNVNGSISASPVIPCLKNNNINFSSMPNLQQIEALVQAYSPIICFHPKDNYRPSSVNWYFENGALLYTNGADSNPVSIENNGLNLPQGGSNDGTFWLDLPIDEDAKERVKKGDLESSAIYLHIKPMLGATFTDIQMWIFYPFNGPGRAKLGLIDIPLGRIGEHIGDWEHLTLRISNFNGILYKIYFSQHSRGTWYDASMLEFQNGSSKAVAYSALNGHPFYPKPGLVLQGFADIGIRNETTKSNVIMDTGAKYSVVSAEYLSPSIVEPPWLSFARKWGPKITYEIGVFGILVKILPAEVFGEEGPTGPKMKSGWDGDER